MTKTLPKAPPSNLTGLVLRAQRGDRQAQGDLLQRFEASVQAIALRRLGNYAEAQELCQEVFLHALRKLHQLRDPECFGGWLRAIARRMAINRSVRRPACINLEPQAIAATCAETRTPFSAAVAAEQAAEVRRGLDRLGPVDRQTLIAFYVDGQSLIDMSDQFEAPIGTIKRRLHVARKRLAKQVEVLEV
jgi:RNA polymerase sigma-70 factor (ECF subfamily)